MNPFLTITVGLESARQPDLEELHKLTDATLLDRTPREFAYLLTPDELSSANVYFFVLRVNNQVAGSCALVWHYPEMIGELKRLFIMPDWRKLQLSDILQLAIQTFAKQIEITKLVVETGQISQGYLAAHRHLHRCGFDKCGPFLYYKESDWSEFFSKDLT